MKPVRWVVAALVLAQLVPAQAQTKLVTQRVKLGHTPAVWFENAFVDLIGTPRGSYPRGITAIIALEKDNTVIIRGERAAVVGLAESFRALDVSPRQMKLTLRALHYKIEVDGKRTEESVHTATVLGATGLPQTMRLDDGSTEPIVARLIPRLNGDNTATVEAAIDQLISFDGTVSARGVRRVLVGQPTVIASFVRAERSSGVAFSSGSSAATGRRIGVDLELSVAVNKQGPTPTQRKSLPVWDDGSL